MPEYRDIDWLPLTVGLTVLMSLAAWFAWQRRDAAAGLRVMAWALVPLAAYLTGVIRLAWDIGRATTRWALHLVFSPVVWLGVGLAGVSFVLFVVSGFLRRRRPGGTGQQQPSVRARARSPVGSGASTLDDDFADIEEILRRRGIS